MLKILWLSPNFNHYKARFLNHLAKEKDVELTIFSGSGRSNMGDKELDEVWSFNQIKVDVPKKMFGRSNEVKKKLTTCFNDYDWVLIPAEKKNLPLFLYALKLKKANPSVQLFSYNHSMLKSSNGILGFLDFKLTRFFNKHLDRVVFYSEDACEKAIQNKLVDSSKAYWANNTIDDIEIAKYYTYQLPPEDTLRILFIGRLIPSKRVSDVISYFKKLKQKHQSLKLEIIGDGPEKTIVKEAVEHDNDIIWHSTLVDEAEIAPIMSRASLVFIPGLSGLSINHAFAYGRPYLTLKADKHGPEISYLDQSENGYILNHNEDENINVISELLKDRELLIRFCDNAKSKGEQLSVKKWVSQLKSSLLHE